jgi:peptidoglycan/LPS O-acetylase OafA/YrhL
VKKRVEEQVLISKSNRFMELEGLRVVAAVIVVLYHMWLIFYPGTFLGVGTDMAPVQNMPFEDNLFQHPLSAFLSGTFAVGIFFVLSGFVLSVGFFKKKDPNVAVRLASKRYLRLMLPAAASIMLAWLALQLGAHSIIERVGSETHSGWLLSQWPIKPDFFGALWEGTIAMFTIGEVHYNSALWTINIELIGSFLVFGAMLLGARSRYRWVMYMTLCYLFLDSWLLGFVAGMIMADLYVNKEGLIQKLSPIVAYPLLAVGVILGGYPITPVENSLYKFMTLTNIGPLRQIAFHVSVGAILTVISILALPGARKFLAHKWISGFGKYTYSLYLAHMTVLLTVCTSIFMLASPIGFHKASLIAIIVTLIVLVPLTYLFEKYIDAPAIRLSTFCSDIFLGRKELDIKAKYTAFRLSMEAKLSMLKRRRIPEVMTEIEVE